jgi:hypothetical protein
LSYVGGSLRRTVMRYFSPSKIVAFIKPQSMRWTEHILGMGKIVNTRQKETTLNT